jgi:hypothetical protein
MSADTALVRSTGGDVDQARDRRIVSGLRDHDAPVRMANENRRPLQSSGSPVGQSHNSAGEPRRPTVSRFPGGIVGHYGRGSPWGEPDSLRVRSSRLWLRISNGESLGSTFEPVVLSC